MNFFTKPAHCENHNSCYNLIAKIIIQLKNVKKVDSSTDKEARTYSFKNCRANVFLQKKAPREIFCISQIERATSTFVKILKK